MSSMSEQLQTWRQDWERQWRAMSANERLLLLVAAWLAALTVLVLVGLRPAWRTLQMAPAQLHKVEAELSGMRQLAAEAQTLKQRPAVQAVQAEGSLQSATARLGPSAGLSRQGDRAVLTFQSLSGEALATWLEEVRVGARARPLEAEWTQTPEGTYRGSVTLGLDAGGAL